MTIDERINKAEGDAKRAEIQANWGIGTYFMDRTEALEYAKECRQLAEWLKELKQLREQTSWIPVTKRLPDDYDRYLISTDDGIVEIVNYGDTNDLPNEIAFHQWDNEEWQCWKPNVTAWMPRPKAYKSEEREQIPNIKVTAEEAAEVIQNLTKAGISQEDIEASDLPLYDQEPCDTCGYEEGSMYCKEDCPYEAKIGQEPCEDAISRQAVLERIKREEEILYTPTGMNYLIRVIKGIPSVTPQPKTGHWIEIDGKSALCSCCNRNNTLYGDFCKWCGAKMVEPQERSDKNDKTGGK